MNRINLIRIFIMRKLFTFLVSVVAMLTISMGTASSQCKVFSVDTMYVCPADLSTPIDLESQVVGINFEEGKGIWYAIPVNTEIGAADTCKFPLANSTEVEGGIFITAEASEGQTYTFLYRSTVSQGCGIEQGGVAIATIITVSKGNLEFDVCENKGPLDLLGILNAEVPQKIGEGDYTEDDIVFYNYVAIVDDNGLTYEKGDVISDQELVIDGKGGGHPVKVGYEVKRRPGNGDSISCMLGDLVFNVYDSNDSIVIKDDTTAFCSKDEYASTDSIRLNDLITPVLHGTWTALGSAPVVSSTGRISKGDAAAAAAANGGNVKYTYSYKKGCDPETDGTATLTIEFKEISIPNGKKDTTSFCSNENGRIDFDLWIGAELPNGDWSSTTTPDFSGLISEGNVLNTAVLPAGEHTFKWVKNSTVESNCDYPDSLFFTIVINEAYSQGDIVRKFCKTSGLVDYDLNSLLEADASGKWQIKDGSAYADVSDPTNFNLDSFATTDGPVGELVYIIGDADAACGVDSVSVFLSFVDNIILNDREKYFCIYMDDAKNINIANILGSELEDGKWLNPTTAEPGSITGTEQNPIFNGSLNVAGDYVFTYTGKDCNGVEQTATVTIKLGTELP